MKPKFGIISVFIFCFSACILANHLGVFKLDNVIVNQSPVFTKPQLDSMINTAKNKNYNTHLGIFINLKVHSGKYRFFLVNLDSNKIILKGLCCHGSGKASYKEKASFSNQIGSNYSSQGFYKISSKYTGIFGDSYKLIGLSNTNSNAFDRFVVLHSHNCVPPTPVPVSICQSLGCPTLAPEVFQKLEPFIDSSNKPILLWIL